MSEWQRQQQSNLENNRWQTEFDYNKSRDSISDQRYNTEYSDNKAQQALANKSAKLENQIRELELKRAQTGYMSPSEQLQLEQAKFQLQQAKAVAPYELEKSKLEISNLQSQINNRNSGGARSGVKNVVSNSNYIKQAKDMLDKSTKGTPYTVLEMNSSGNYAPVVKYRYDTTKSDVENYIRSLPLDAAQKAEISNYIGL
jgi:hypothetical protein